MLLLTCASGKTGGHKCCDFRKRENWFPVHFNFCHTCVDSLLVYNLYQKIYFIQRMMYFFFVLVLKQLSVRHLYNYKPGDLVMCDLMIFQPFKKKTWLFNFWHFTWRNIIDVDYASSNCNSLWSNVLFTSLFNAVLCTAIMWINEGVKQK